MRLFKKHKAKETMGLEAGIKECLSCYRNVRCTECDYEDENNIMKAQIARLKIENQSLRLAANSYKLHYNKARTEAVKEFVKKSEMAVFVKQDEQREQMFDILKSHRATLSYFAIEQATDNWIRGYGEAVQDVIGILDNLLKEMAGDTE